MSEFFDKYFACNGPCEEINRLISAPNPFSALTQQVINCLPEPASFPCELISYCLTGISGSDIYVTGFTYNNANTFTLFRNDGVDLNSSFNTVTGLTVNGTLDATTILSGGTNLTTIIESLDTNTFVTGGTYSDVTDTITLTRNDGGTIDITGVTDTFTTGATYDNGTALATFTKNDGTTYTLDLSTIDVNNTFVTGFTYNDANTFTISNNDGTSFNSSINIMTGFTVNNGVGDGFVTINSTSGQELEINQRGNNFNYSTPNIQVGTTGANMMIGSTGGIGSYPSGSYPGLNLNTTTGDIFLFNGGYGGTGAVMDFGGGNIRDIHDIQSSGNWPLKLYGGPGPNDANDGIQMYTADNLNVYTKKFEIKADTGTPDAYFTNINNFGVNTTTPQYTLDVNGTTRLLGLTANTLNLVTTPTLNNSGTDILIRNSSTGEVEYRPVSGISTTDTFVTGFTYNDANTFTISRNDGVDLSTSINTMTGLTVNGTLVVDTISATTINGSVSGLTLNDLDDVTSNIPTTPDNTYQGRLLYFDVTDNQWVTGEEYVSTGNVTIWAKKGTAGTIDKGCPVYITGFDDDIHEVELANATTASTMPVIGFTGEDFDNAGVYPLITFGKLVGVDTTSTVSTINPNGETWAVNDVLYMNTTDGGLTKFRPPGTNTQIQRIAKVLRVATTSGQLFIFNTARTAGLPNLTTDYLWLGNGNDTPQEVIRTDVGITTTGFTYNNNNTLFITDDNGGTLSTTINQMSGLTINGTISATTLDATYILSGGTNLSTLIESIDQLQIVLNSQVFS